MRILRQLGEPPFEICKRNVERARQVTECELVFGSHVEQHHAAVVEPVHKGFERHRFQRVEPVEPASPG